MGTRPRQLKCRECALRCEGFFCDLPADALKMFEAIQTRVQYQEGTTIFSQGEPLRDLFMICSGKVKVSASSSSGRSVIVKIARQGEILGVPALLENHLHQFTAQTLQASQLGVIRSEQFKELLNRFPSATMRAAEHLSRDCNDAYERIRTIGLAGSMLERLARLLLDLTADHAEDKNGEMRMKLALTHEEISQLLGTSRETVSRSLSQLKSKQLAEIRGATLVILDRERLSTVGGVDSVQ